MTGYAGGTERAVSMAHIIIASHGGLAAGMLDSVRMIAGDVAGGVETFGLQPGENPNDFYEELYERVSGTDEQYVIMCDLKGGSVHNALFRLTELSNVVVFAGTTLAMALEVILTVQDRMTAEQAQMILDVTREGVVAQMGGEAPADGDEDDEF